MHINLSPEEHLTDSQVICGILPLLHVPPPRGVGGEGVRVAVVTAAEFKGRQNGLHSEYFR